MKAIKNAKIGVKAGRLTLIDIKYELGGNNKMRTIFYCVCDCGTILPPMQPSSFGNKTSCGCKNKERLHHKAHTKVWRAWQGMKKRCYNINDPKYRIYGAAGRFVCDGLNEFKHFLNILGEPPSKSHSLDRENNNGNYTCGVCKMCLENKHPINVRWATPIQQSNNISTNVIVEYCGTKMTLSNASKLAGLPYKSVFNRIRYCGWDELDALTIPLGKPHSYKKIKHNL